MPQNKYIKISIGNKSITYNSADDLPVGISYQLEDVEDFQTKASSSALNVKMPATPENDFVGNTFHNPAIEDLTDGEIFRSSQPAIIEANGIELLVGKAFLNSVTHTDKPEEYEFSFFGNNADWIIDLKESTFYEFLQHILFVFSKANIEASWVFDGTNELLPYVFAPVRYGNPPGDYTIVDVVNVPVNNNMLPVNMRPSISVYWLIYWGFKSMGYRLQSGFFNTNYFRRLVMPWTFGAFLASDSTRWAIHKFLAKSPQDSYLAAESGQTINKDWDLGVTNDSTDGAFDDNNDYTFTGGQMVWTYNPPHFGKLQVTFSMTVEYQYALDGGSSQIFLIIAWFKNGVIVPTGEDSNKILIEVEGSGKGSTEVFFTTIIEPGDYISAVPRVLVQRGKSGKAELTARVLQFKLEYFKTPLGGDIAFANYDGLKKIKFLDFLKGITDCFDLTWQTDPITKTVVVEPTHGYSLTNNLSQQAGGYFNNDFIDWNDKQDISKVSTMELYKDYEREVVMRYKEDSQDGILKLLEDRHLISLAAAKYIFPERFKSGKKEIENRFFAATVHMRHNDWKSITGVAPQLPVIAPENISNTSASEAENTFEPKICWYKGNISGVGGWVFDGVKNDAGEWSEGSIKITFPFMFSVNYHPGGEDDPILSYCDEKIGLDTSFNIGKGLLKRFFWQRLAIMRNGQWYETWFKLNNFDISNIYHREHKSLRGQKWELVKIDNYQPLQEETTKCLLRKWVPVSLKDLQATYPSAQSISTGVVVTNDKFDSKYQQLICLTTDIPS